MNTTYEVIPTHATVTPAVLAVLAGYLTLTDQEKDDMIYMIDHDLAEPLVEDVKANTKA